MKALSVLTEIPTWNYVDQRTRDNFTESYREHFLGQQPPDDVRKAWQWFLRGWFAKDAVQGKSRVANQRAARARYNAKQENKNEKNT